VFALSLSVSERRRVSRYVFREVAEVKDEQGRHVVSRTTDLGRFGCFMQTMLPFSVGAAVNLQITHDETRFSALGKVAYHLTDGGIGIASSPPEKKNPASSRRVRP
jgi:C4-dicarboxylate-specific signal transduction histidine kinase